MTLKNIAPSSVGRLCLVLLIFLLIGQVVQAADPCLGNPRKPDYPTEQTLTFHFNSKSEGGKTTTRTISARRSGTNKPGAKLTISSKKAKEFKIFVTVVPILSTDKERNETVASLDVIKMRVLPPLAGAQAKEVSAEIEDNLIAWRERLSGEHKINIQKAGVVELPIKIEILNASKNVKQIPNSVSFVASIKNYPDLYNIAKGLEVRLDQYRQISNQYNQFDLDRLKQGIATLKKIDANLNLFKLDQSAVFEQAVILQKAISSTSNKHKTLISEIQQLQTDRARIVEKQPSIIYVSVDKKKWSKKKKGGFVELEKALAHAKKVDQNLYQSLLNNYNQEQDRLYQKNKQRLDWLEGKKRNIEIEAKDKQTKALKEIDPRISSVKNAAEKLAIELGGLKSKKYIHFSNLNKYIDSLTSNIEDNSYPANINESGNDTEVESALYDALDWAVNQQAYLQNQREQLDEKLGRQLRQWKTLDRQLAVSTRNIAEHRLRAFCSMRKALSQGGNSEALDHLSEFNKSAGELKKALSLASDSAEKYDYARKIYSDIGPEIISRLGEKISILSDAANKIESWSGPVENLLQLNQQLENNNPMFLVTVLEGTGAIAEKVPVIGHATKMVLGYQVFLSKKIISRGQEIHSEIVRQVIDHEIHDEGRKHPSRHLYSSKEVRDIIESGRYPTDTDIQEIATSFQADRILYLLTHRGFAR